MVILDTEDSVKLKTVKQIACITRLLQSSYFSKREFIELMKRNRNQIVTSYDASVLISYLISALRFRKKFLSKKHKAHLKCDYCNGRKDLTRLYGVQFDTQIIRCMNCDEKQSDALADDPGFQEAAQKLKDMAEEDFAKPCNKNLVLDVGGVDVSKAKLDEAEEAAIAARNKPLALQ